jgi:hypothetical protein
MTKWGKKIEDIMTAVSFAEEGEFHAAREALKEDRCVLLVLKEGQVEQRILKYAVNACKRIGSDLDILYISETGSMESRLREFQSELKKENIKFRIIQRKGIVKEEVIKHTSLEKNILFVVIGSEDEPDINNKSEGREISKQWQGLKCPLVVIGV